MAEADPVRHREQLVLSLNEEGLEKLTLELVEPNYPRAHRTRRGPDGGVDIFSDHDLPPEYGWQCKNYTNNKVDWAKCRRSLDSALSEPHPPRHYTFVFPRALSKTEHDYWRETYLLWAREEFGERLPELNYWDNLPDRLESRPDLVDQLAGGAFGAYIRPLIERMRGGSGDPPRLSVVTIGENGDKVDRLIAPTPRPWPVDADRIVANAMADAEQTVVVRHPALDSFAAISDPLSVRPSKRAHERAREKFRAELPEYAEKLRAWLDDYVAAAGDRANTFDLQLQVVNAAGGGHAAAVEIIVELPPEIELVEDRPTMAMPPEPPRYLPPRPQPMHGVYEPHFMGSIQAHSLYSGLTISPLTMDPYLAWTVRDQELEATIGYLHASRSVAVADPLLVRAAGPGEHVIRWRVYTASAHEPAAGTITLVVPPDPERPAFGRLSGITTYPDVPLIGGGGDDDEIEVRSSDPPARPGLAPGDLLRDRLRHRHAELIWLRLGLDPDDDGPLVNTKPGDVRRVKDSPRPARKKTEAAAPQVDVPAE